MNEITKRDLIYAFTGHPSEHDRVPSTEKLIERLRMGLAQLKKAQASHDTLLAKTATNVLQGALIRFAQASGDPEVAALVDEIIGITTEIFAI